MCEHRIPAKYASNGKGNQKALLVTEPNTIACMRSSFYCYNHVYLKYSNRPGRRSSPSQQLQSTLYFWSFRCRVFSDIHPSDIRSCSPKGCDRSLGILSRAQVACLRD